MSLNGDQPQETIAKETRINALLTQLRSIKGQQIDHRNTLFPFSNDREVEKLLAQIITQEKDIKADIKVGFVVGAGGLITLGKEMDDIDVWIAVDKNANIFEAAKKRDECIEQESTVEKARDLPLTPIDKSLLDIEKQSYGEKHYLASQEGFDKSQQFIQKKNIAYICGDLTEDGFLEQIGTTLNQFGAQITFANMTNVLDCIYQKPQDQIDWFHQGFNVLPIHDQCVFLYSRHNIGQTSLPLYARSVVGKTAYLQNK